MFRTPRTPVNTYVPGVASKYACSWGPPREDSKNASKYTCSGPQTRHETTHTHTPTTKKTKTIKIETMKCTSRSFFKIRQKQLPKTSENLPKSIKNRSKMSPRAPSETPRARDLFLRPFLMFFGPKWSPKWSQKLFKKYVFFACFSMSFYFDF